MYKKILMFTVGLVLVTSPAFADVTGNWRSAKSDKGASISVKIKKCGANICGHIVKVHNSDEKGGVGKSIIEGMKTKDGKYFYGGRIYAPDTKKWYTSKMSLKGNRLIVSGCVAKIFCRSQTWKRE